MTKQEMTSIINMLDLAYSKDKFSPTVEMCEAWYDIIGDLPFDDMKEATKRFIRKSEFAPTIAGIMKEYNDIVEGHDQERGQINKLRDDALSDYPTYKENFNYVAACKAFTEKSGRQLSNAKKLHDIMHEKAIAIHNGEDYVPVIDFIRSVDL